MSSAERQQIKDLQCEVRELRRANEILEAASVSSQRSSTRDRIVTAFMEEHRDRWGVEPICAVLPIAPSTYYAAKARQPSDRAVRDKALTVEIRRVHAQNYGVYGAPKVWTQLNREASRWPGARWSG